MASTISVPFSELDVDYGFEEGSNQQGGYVRKPYLVAWADRFKFMADMAGISQNSGAQTGGTWIRGRPYSYPEAPWLYAQEVSIKPVGRFYNTTPISYDSCIITVTFGPLTWDGNQSQDDPFFFQSLSQDPTENKALSWATQNIDFGYETYPAPSSALHFTGDGAKIDFPMQITIPVISMDITWPQYPVMPMSKIEPYVGHVNASTFLGRAAETVFFIGAKTTQETMSDGTKVQKVTLSFKYRANPWNEFLRQDSIVFMRVEDGSGNAFYKTADFGALLALFVPPAPQQ